MQTERTFFLFLQKEINSGALSLCYLLVRQMLFHNGLSEMHLNVIGLVSLRVQNAPIKLNIIRSEANEIKQRVLV
jgi:hypothetical protein